MGGRGCIRFQFREVFAKPAAQRESFSGFDTKTYISAGLKSMKVAMCAAFDIDIADNIKNERKIHRPLPRTLA